MTRRWFPLVLLGVGCARIGYGVRELPNESDAGGAGDARGPDTRIVGDVGAGDRAAGDVTAGDLTAGDLNGGDLNGGDLNGGDLNPAAITFVSETRVDNNTCDSGTWTLGAFAPNDVGVFWYYHRSNSGIITEPATVVEVHDSKSSGRGHIWIGYRVLQAGDSSFSFITSNGANSDCATAVAVFRGVDTSANPFEDTAVDEYTNECMPDPPAVTTSTDGCMIITGGGLRVGPALLQTGPSTPPANYSLTFEIIGGYPDLNAYHRLQTTAGLEDPGPFTVQTDCENDGRIFTGALRPAP